MTQTTSIFLAMCLLGAITFFYRFSFISERGKKVAAQIPDNFLKLLAPAAFTAIVTNSLLSAKGSPQEIQLKMAVAAASLVVAYFTKSMVFTLLFGLILLFLLQSYAI